MAEKTQENYRMRQLAELVKTFRRSNAYVAVLDRRGIKFIEFIQAYYSDGKLPQYRIRVQGGQEEVYYEKAEYEKRLEELDISTDIEDHEAEQDLIVAEELHEIDRVNQINERLKTEFGLDLSDFLLKPSKNSFRRVTADKICADQRGNGIRDRFTW